MTKPRDPFTDPVTGTKPIERSERVEGQGRMREGERMLGFVRWLFPAGGLTTVLGAMEGWAFWQFTGAACLLLAGVAAYGAFRLIEGKRMKERGRLAGSQGLH